MIISRSVHVAANSIISFFFMINIPLYICIPCLLYHFKYNISLIHGIQKINLFTKQKTDTLTQNTDLRLPEGKEGRGINYEFDINWWHHRLRWVLGVGDGQGGLACCSPWDHKESDMTEWLNWTELIHATAYITKKAMAPHSNTLAWKIPGTGEPGGLPSMESHRVRHDWSNLAAAAATAYKIDNQQGPTVQHREFYSVSYNT